MSRDTVSEKDRMVASEFLFDLMSRYPPLTKKKQKEIAQHLPKKWAREKLINHNIRFVHKIAMEYCTFNMHMDDKIMAGIEGLIDGIDRFDKEAENGVLTYCQFWIRQRIQHWSRVSHIIKIPHNVLKDKKDALSVSDEGDDEKILDHTDLTPSRLEKVRHVQSLRRVGDSEFWETDLGKTAKSGSEPDIIQNLPDNNSPSQFDEIETDNRKKVVGTVLDSLRPRERRVVEMYFWEDKTLSDIGEELGFTRERARQIKEEAYIRMREKLKYLVS